MWREIGLQARLEVCLGLSPHSIPMRKVSADSVTSKGRIALAAWPLLPQLDGGPLPACAPGRCLQAPRSSPGLPAPGGEAPCSRWRKALCAQDSESMWDLGGLLTPCGGSAFPAKVLKLTVSRWYRWDYRKDFHRCLHLWDSDSVDLGWKA